MYRPGLIIFLLFTYGLAVGQVDNLYQVADSLKKKDSVFIYFWNDEEVTYQLDSVPIIFEHHNRVHLRTLWGGQDIGNNGSEVRPVLFSLDNTPGLRMGYNAMQSLRWRFHNLPFFQSAEAHTRLFASQGSYFNSSIGSAQDQSHFEGEFSKAFAHNVRASIYYRKISEDGLFNQDESNHTQFAVRVSQQRMEGRLLYSLSYIRNVFNRQSYGGLDSLTFFKDENFDVRSTIPIKQIDAGLRDEQNIFNLGLKWQLTGRKDNQGLFIDNLLEFESRHYKYYDHDITSIDSLFRPWLNHPTKLRHTWHLQSLSNDLALRWSSRLFPKIFAGFQYARHKIDDEASSRILNYGTLNGGLNFKVRQLVQMQIRSYLELLEDVGDFDITANLKFTWPNVGAINGKASFGLQSPEQIYQLLSFNFSEVQQTDLPPTQYFHFGGKLLIDKLKLEFEAQQYVLNDWNYRSINLLPTSSDLTSITRFGAQADWTFGPIRVFNALFYQLHDKELIPLPEWGSRHVLAYENSIFKENMWIRAGIEARTYQITGLPYFLPMTGEFISGLTNPEPFQYHLDPFLVVQVDRFTAFVKGERLQSLWNEVPVQLASGYPDYDWMFRFGINWRYLN